MAKTFGWHFLYIDIISRKAERRRKTRFIVICQITNCRRIRMNQSRMFLHCVLMQKLKEIGRYIPTLKRNRMCFQNESIAVPFFVFMERM